MNKIDDLIKQYCPNGVEYDIIKNICNIIKGIKQKQRQGSYKSRDL